MQFTEKEIELAKQLKEARLEWNPEIGDHYIYDLKSNRYSIVTMIDYDHGDKGWIYVKSPFDGLRNTRLCCWLPLWHQVRRILTKRGWFLEEHYDVPDEHLVSLWLSKEKGKTVTGVFGCDIIEVEEGETDLEIMYKALLEVITDVNKGVDE